MSDDFKSNNRKLSYTGKSAKMQKPPNKNFVYCREFEKRKLES